VTFVIECKYSMSIIHVYAMPQIVTMMLDEVGAPSMNYPVNSTDIRFYQGVRNVVDLYVKDIDRKPVTLSGQVPVMHILTRDRSKLLLTRSLTVVDTAKGRYRLTVEPDAMHDWPLGGLTYVAGVTDGTSETLLYTDREKATTGVLYLLDGPLPQPIEAITIPASDFVLREPYTYSGAYPGAAQVGNLSGLHTIAVYGVAFTGRVLAQGSLDAQPSSDDSAWATIAAYDLDLASGVTPFGFEGNYQWIRFAVETLDGTFEKIVYRN
jgi:hypothetical protein